MSKDRLFTTLSTMTEEHIFTAIGLMSGTSLDGIDIALIKTDGQQIYDFGPMATCAYDKDFRRRLHSVLGAKKDKDNIIANIATELTQRHIDLVRDFMQKNKLSRNDIDLIGFHGQTISHIPTRRFTWQIGYGEMLAEELGIETVTDFRIRDTMAGGQGAPLAPIYHQALAMNLTKPLGVLNLGGVGNITWIGATERDLLAFDTGPGNALIDDWVNRHTEATYDQDGKFAATGNVDKMALKFLMNHPYFMRPPPKSLDRNNFNLLPVEKLKFEDAAATLSAFTVESVVQAIAFFPAPIRCLIVTGGGRHNQTLMNMLLNRLKIPTISADTVGWNGDALEAQAFAFLAVRCKLMLPITFPETTGCSQPTTGGQIHLPS